MTLPASTQHKAFLRQAIDLAIASAASQGGPFGAVIVKHGKVIGRGHNQVTSHCDPSAHAEIVAIRDACKNLNDYQLKDCIIYASCQPCPMCMSAIYWARIPQLIYAATAEDAARAGFDDQFIYDELAKDESQRNISITHLEHDQAQESFRIWQENTQKKEY